MTKKEKGLKKPTKKVNVKKDLPVKEGREVKGGLYYGINPPRHAE